MKNNRGNTGKASEEALSDEALNAVSGGYNEDEDPAFEGYVCPRGVSSANFPCKGKCYSTYPASKCTYLDEDDDGSMMIFTCSRYNYQKTE